MFWQNTSILPPPSPTPKLPPKLLFHRLFEPEVSLRCLWDAALCLYYRLGIGVILLPLPSSHSDSSGAFCSCYINTPLVDCRQEALLWALFFFSPICVSRSPAHLCFSETADSVLLCLGPFRHSIFLSLMLVSISLIINECHSHWQVIFIHLYQESINHWRSSP